MARKAGTPRKGRSFRLHVTLPGEVIAKMDARAAELTAETPGSTITRTDVARRAIWAFVFKVGD